MADATEPTRDDYWKLVDLLQVVVRDIEIAASDNMVMLRPEPGTDLARLLIANRLLKKELVTVKQERDDALAVIKVLSGANR